MSNTLARRLVVRFQFLENIVLHLNSEFRL